MPPEAALLYGELNSFCIAVLALLLFKLRSSAGQRRQQQLFFLVLIGNMAAFFTDVLWPMVNRGGDPAMYGWNLAVNCANYLLSGLNAYIWFVCSETMLDSPFLKSARRRAVCSIPGLTVTLISILSLWTGWFFYVDESAVYHRGPFYPLQLFVVYGYIIVAALHALVTAQRKENYLLRSKYLTLTSFAVYPVCLGAFQVFLPSLPLANAGITLAVLSVFINLQEQQISLDPLTQLNNRRHLAAYLGSILQRPANGRLIYLLMADVDTFKQINDRFGHVEGDAALIRVADGLRTGSRGWSCFLARYGGDEFSVVCTVDRPEEVQALCRSIQAAIDRLSAKAGAPYALRLSIGCARLTEEAASVQEFIQLADRELYRVKSDRKGRA